MDTANDPKQAEVDAAVAAMAAASTTIATPAKSAEAAVAGAFGASSLEPAERLRLALARRTAIESAWATIRARADADVGDLGAAVANADAPAILLAVETQALRAWADANLGQLDTTAHGLNRAVLQEVVAAISADAPAVLASLAEHTSDPTTEYLRRIAIAATTMDDHVFDLFGRPTRPKVLTLSALSTVVPRS